MLPSIRTIAKRQFFERRRRHSALGYPYLTGPMIFGAIEIATAAKKLNPELPVIFGGWHPSLLPERTYEPFVDMVVRGQGDSTLVEVAEALAEKRSLGGIAGLSWKRNGAQGQNPEHVGCNCWKRYPRRLSI